MTPDELRRMDNDLCIIFEKGIKPIKANKYYYFKYPEAKIVERYPANHNDVKVERGPWRKYNPMNPYEEGSENKEDFPSLDSLFEEDMPSTSNTSETKSDDIFPNLDSLNSEDNSKESTQKDTENKTSSADIDIQKELEAKFDELFGALDDND